MKKRQILILKDLIKWIITGTVCVNETVYIFISPV